MSNLELWSGVVGFFLPLVMAVIIQTGWQQQIQAVLAFLAVLVASAVTVFLQTDDWDWSNWLNSALVILVTTISAYKGFWKPTGIAPTIEEKTSPTPQ